MTIKAFYNEIDPYCCAWLSNLMDASHITPGVICDRSIEDLRPSDVRGYDRVHFFAGIGVWDYALNLAGWGSRPVWSGSCPCQPFSAAGQGAGFDDQRHLWPHFHHLIKECQPAIVLGEQVASKDADPWIDLVCDDLEAMGYAFGAVPFPSAGVGAPHIRDRLYWVGHASGAGLEGLAGDGGAARRKGPPGSVAATGVSGGLGNADSIGTGRDGRPVSSQVAGQDGQHIPLDADASGGDGGLADANKVERRRRAEDAKGQFDWEASRRDEGDCKPAGRSDRGIQGSTDTSPTNGYWRNADWLYCRDGRWRPVEPGTFPLAHGASARVGRLRAYGNAINAEAARVFIEAVMASQP